MHASLTQQSWSGLTMPLSRHSVGTYHEMSSHTTRQGTLSQSSQLAEPLWTDPGIKSGINVRKKISTVFQKWQKHAGGEWIAKHFPKILAREQKANKEALQQLHLILNCVPYYSPTWVFLTKLHRHFHQSCHHQHQLLPLTCPRHWHWHPLDLLVWPPDSQVLCLL